MLREFPRWVRSVICCLAFMRDRRLSPHIPSYMPNHTDSSQSFLYYAAITMDGPESANSFYQSDFLKRWPRVVECHLER